VSHEVFVDASAWIAVSDRRDKYHLSASEAYNRLIRERCLLVTTNLVIAEAYILIRRTGGHAPAMRLLSSLRGSPRLSRVYSDARLEALAEVILEKHSDQDFSYADAVSFAVMQEQGIQEAFTFDNHFASLGFQMLPRESER
jgi:predicted nucleic acid-binding protein